METHKNHNTCQTANIAELSSNNEKENERKNSVLVNADTNSIIKPKGIGKNKQKKDQTVVSFAVNLLQNNPEEGVKDSVPILAERSTGETLEPFLFGSKIKCFYCGDDYDMSIDHVIPNSYNFLKRRQNHKLNGCRVYSCMDCNVHLSCNIFQSFLDRFLFARQYIESKYIRTDVNWSKEELEQLDYKLQKNCERHNFLVQLHNFRLSWPFNVEFKEMVDDLYCLIERSNNFTKNFFQSFINEYFY